MTDNPTRQTPPVELRHHPKLRALVENPYVQSAFHAAGGFGLGLFVAPVVPREPAIAVGVVLLAAAVIGHYIAVWSDPELRKR
jgi:hypothetical protein